MKLRTINRFAMVQKRLPLRKGTPWYVRMDYRDEFLEGGPVLFKGMEVGQIVVVEAFSFPHVGRVIEFDEFRVVLGDAVRILYDGRHGEFARGKPPASAEIEKTHSPLYIPVDFCGPWAPYAGEKIPKEQ